MVIVLFCSFLKKNKLNVIKKGDSLSLCTLTPATRTSYVYNICSTLRFPVTDDSLFYNSLPRLLPSGKIPKIVAFDICDEVLFGFIYDMKQLVREYEQAAATAATTLYCSAALPIG